MNGTKGTPQLASSVRPEMIKMMRMFCPFIGISTTLVHLV
ncbi:hypothetical protein SAMN04488041_105116 [Sulfitobacter pontiacus]|uniref:Uncharacterized protein n=1 Tax=Sulfitobacter pontiacus TaxID=60137 RepID=A0A1H2ZWD4_9RHOB|nr:hypothetical protein SAMN04488041_105116 [Sulfitobacter pontiacus]